VAEFIQKSRYFYFINKFPPKCRNAESSNVIIVKSRNNSRLKQKTKQRQIIMKYALLFHEKTEHFARRQEPRFMDAWGAYVDTIRAGGVFVTGSGLQPPETATMVSVRNGKRSVHDGPYAETKEFLGGLVIIDVPIWM
jgi:hypothetical protein